MSHQRRKKRLSPRTLTVAFVIGNLVYCIVARDPVVHHVHRPRPVVTTTTTSLPPLPPSELSIAMRRDVYMAWAQVAWCETHRQWHRDEPRADGGLGILRSNWIVYGGLEYAPAPHLATAYEQIVIARRIQAHAGLGNFVPDQHGCDGPW